MNDTNKFIREKENINKNPELQDFFQKGEVHKHLQNLTLDFIDQLNEWKQLLYS